MRRRNWRPSIVLALACVVLAGLAVRPWLDAAEPPAADPGGAAAAAVAPIAMPRVLGALARYAETVERPLFLAGRRAISDAGLRSAQEPVPRLALGGWQLTGVIIAPARRIALLTPIQGGQTLRLTPGEEIDGWRIETVREDGVTLRAGALVEHLPLDRPRR